MAQNVLELPLTDLHLHLLADITVRTRLRTKA